MTDFKHLASKLQEILASLQDSHSLEVSDKVAGLLPHYLKTSEHNLRAAIKEAQLLALKTLPKMPDSN